MSRKRRNGVLRRRAEVFRAFAQQESPVVTCEVCRRTAWRTEAKAKDALRRLRKRDDFSCPPGMEMLVVQCPGSVYWHFVRRRKVVGHGEVVHLSSPVSVDGGQDSGADNPGAQR